MPIEPRWNGQEPILYFDYEQVSIVASATRSEVFWAFNAVDPLSVREVAEGLKKSPQTVRHHVNELIDAGLLIAASTRQRRARTEELYVHAGMEFRTAPPPITREYREMINKGFDSILRQMARERSAAIRLEGTDSDLNRYLAYRRHTIRVSPEQAAKVKQKLLELSEELRQCDEGDGVRVHYAVYMSLPLGESRSIVDERGLPRSILDPPVELNLPDDKD
ncbi:MAG: helix-turn-helix transcriptional regulator [Chthonomonadaceae bacterium]|nr:helix-turn-helix transcriptional regulator [Chthonomonadaceae bacterium]